MTRKPITLPEGIGKTIARHRRSGLGSLVVGIRRTGVCLQNNHAMRRWTSWDRLAKDYKLERKV